MSAEEVIVDYSYNGNHNTDFISVSLKIENVIDDRGSDPRLIADEYLGKATERNYLHSTCSRNRAWRCRVSHIRSRHANSRSNS